MSKPLFTLAGELYEIERSTYKTWQVNRYDRAVTAALPGFEFVPAARAQASAEHLGASLTLQLRAPARSISAAVGAMETRSPLFRDSTANPQPGLFPAAPPTLHPHQILLDLIDSAGDPGTDLLHY